jgi:2-phosphosulfolactate phosphatase
LADRGIGPLSPEAQAAEAAYRDAFDRLPELLHESSGGRELTAYGFAEDVAVAAEPEASRSVPVLRDDAFRAVP